jgi:acyl-CoA reductase-like NAD-dependent aldehyde dehydrogenase
MNQQSQLQVCAVACLLLQAYDAFAELVSAKVSALRVGDGMAPETTHGPLITPAGVEKVGVATRNIHHWQPG